MTRDETVAFLERYLRAVEESVTSDELRRFYTDDAVLIEHPNKFSPHGETRDLDAIIAALEKGRSHLARQTAEIESMLIEENRAAFTMRWTGVFKTGDAMRVPIAQFCTMRDGRIARQETFDCFEP